MGKIKENLLTVITSMMCVFILFGCTSFNSKAESQATKSYTVDLRNGRVLNVRETFRVGDSLSKDDIDEVMLGTALSLYECTPDSDLNALVTSWNPYQGVVYDVAGDRVHISAVKDAVGTGIYVVNKEFLRKIKREKESSADGILNTFDDMIKGDNVFRYDETRKNDNTYTVKVKYSDSPLVAYYNGENPCTVSFETGYEFEDNGIKYRIIDASGNVSAIGLTKKSKKVTIPDTASIAGYKFEVTDIAKDFMKGDKKATGVTIGANVTSIGKQAFYKCKKLKKVTIKSTKLKSVGKKAFGKNAKKFSVKMPKSCRKAYKKLFKKAKVKI